jgi:hypothetical protein
MTQDGMKLVNQNNKESDTARMMMEYFLWNSLISYTNMMRIF